LAEKDLVRKHAAQLGCHAALDSLQHVRADAAIVRKLLGAKLDPHAGHLTPIFVGGAFIDILKAPPTAHVVDDNRFEIGLLAFDIR
jgi:hypothetical protein